jgi:hypothetical protein
MNSYVIHLFIFDLYKSISYAYALSDVDQTNHLIVETNELYKKQALPRVSTPLLYLGFSAVSLFATHKVNPVLFTPFFSSLSKGISPSIRECTNFGRGSFYSLGLGVSSFYTYDFCFGYTVDDTPFLDYSKNYFLSSPEENHGISNKRAIDAVKPHIDKLCFLCRNSSNPDEILNLFFKLPPEVKRAYFNDLLSAYQDAKNNVKKE